MLGTNITTLAVLAMCLLLIWRHKDNIEKLVSGEESAFRRR